MTTSTTKKMINFTGIRKPAMILSAVLLLASILSLFTNGLNLGVDFTGGTVIEIGYSEATDVDKVRTCTGWYPYLRYFTF